MRASRRGLRVRVQEKENDDQEMRDEQEPNSVSTPIMLVITLNKAGTLAELHCSLITSLATNLPLYSCDRRLRASLPPSFLPLV